MNEYLANAFAYPRVVNDLVNFTADIEGAASPGGKQELLLVNHVISVSSQNCVFFSIIVASLQAGTETIRQCFHDRKPCLFARLLANTDGVQFNGIHRQAIDKCVDQCRALGCFVKETV